MRILELTNFSAGVCGVWSRVREESIRLSERGHEVRVFSSDFVKGDNEKKAESIDKIGKVKINRFQAKKLGGESFMSWKFEKAALKYKPEIIIAHSYRHLHTTRALKIAKKLNCKVFLVTHAPFVEWKSNRTRKEDFFVKAYDFFIGKRKINKFDKVIAISKWELPHLKALGLREDKLEYVPNGIPEEFFDMEKNGKVENKILFLGRVSPIKNLEIALRALSWIPDKKIKLEIVGPREREYYEKLQSLVKEENLDKRVIFSEPVFDVKKKIRKLDTCKIFILPSKREGMPQSLIEAMARSKIVVASDNNGSKDLISEGVNGYMFTNGDSKSLSKKLSKALKSKKNIGKEARKSVEKFSWDKIIRQIEALF